MSYIIFTDLQAATDFVASTDSYLNMPEKEENFTQIGTGVFADWKLGRAMHYCTPQPNLIGDKWFVLYTDVVSLPEGAEVVAELPTGWFPEVEKPEEEKPE